jgi:DNA-binding transcriptional LysR family regulator
MEIRYLRYFVAVADEGSITAAANRLRVAQPSLSRQLRLLEHEIGAALMERNSRGVLLTEAGSAFAVAARDILSAIDRAVADARARAHGTVGELRLGYAPSPTAEILPLALHALEKSAPDAVVSLHDLGGDELLEGLRSGRLHGAVMVDPGPLLPENVVFRPLKRYAHNVAVGPRHPFARLRQVPLARLASEPFVVYDRRHYAEYTTTLRAILEPVTDNPKIAAECDGLTSLISAVLAGRGVAIVPSVFRRLAGSQIRLRAITPSPPPLIVGYAYRADLPLSPLSRRLLKALQEASRDR